MRQLEVEPNEENASPAELAIAMDAAPNKRSYIRLAALRALLLGTPRAQVCLLYDRSDRMVRLWIEMFNRGGIDALASKPRAGRQRKISLQRLEDILVPVLQDPRQAGELHWTGVKLHGWIEATFCVQLGYRTVIDYLHQLNFNLRVPRPWPEKQDPQSRQSFLHDLQQWQQDPEVELWFGDECGVEGDPRPRRRWSLRGSRPKVPYFGTHIRANVIGAVCPASGELVTLIFNGVDTDVFQYFLNELAQAVPFDPSKRRILILDNASWHKASRLNWHHFQVQFLPPYSPDFNPIERLWLRLKADYLADFIAQSSEQLTHKLSEALNALMGANATVASQCSFRK